MIEILLQKHGVPRNAMIYRSGIIGVPITFMTKHNPAQFEVLGKIDSGEINEYNIANPIIGGRTIYKRIAIRRKCGNI